MKRRYYKAVDPSGIWHAIQSARDVTVATFYFRRSTQSYVADFYTDEEFDSLYGKPQRLTSGSYACPVEETTWGYWRASQEGTMLRIGGAQ